MAAGREADPGSIAWVAEGKSRGICARAEPELEAATGREREVSGDVLGTQRRLG